MSDPRETFAGDMFFASPSIPLRLEIIIDNRDAAENPDNPYTLNASVGFTPVGMVDLLFDGEGALIEGDVPTQLRTLARMIEEGRVTR